MEKIQMVDLNGQYLHIKEEVDAAIQEVIDSSAFINGPQVKAFGFQLAKYLNATEVVPCANGTDALQIALKTAAVQQDEYVMVPAFTFVSTAEVVLTHGCTPVFVDVDPDTFTISPESMREKMHEDVGAVIPVHLFGQCADMNGIQKVIDECDNVVKVIEDNAQALGAKYKMHYGEEKYAGTIGEVGTTSFFPSKILGCMGDGGAIIADNHVTAEYARMYANHGQKMKYVYEHVGMNSRLDTLQAAILQVKLRHLDEYIAARQKIAKLYDEAFKDVEGLQIPKRNPDSTHVFHQYTLKVKDGRRDHLKVHLNKTEIPSMIYYPKPLHLQKAFNVFNQHKEGDMPVAEQLSKEVLSLPMHTELTEEQLEYIVTEVKKGLK